MKPKIEHFHRIALLRFLLLKTAIVRQGIKPGEFLRVRHCYQSRNAEGFHFCLYRNDILEILGLNYLELKVDPESSLILFYHEKTLKKVLAEEENQEILNGFGYPQNDFHGQLRFLQKRFSQEKLPHEIGVFIGYPAKDVTGFIQNQPRTPVHRGDWAVFGDAGESLRKMDLYRKTEAFAAAALDVCHDLQTFFEHLSGYLPAAEHPGL